MRLFYVVISIMPAICGAAAGQMTSTPDAPLTPREREMLERIQKLAQRIAVLDGKSGPTASNVKTPESAEAPPAGDLNPATPDVAMPIKGTSAATSSPVPSTAAASSAGMPSASPSTPAPVSTPAASPSARPVTPVQPAAPAEAAYASAKTPPNYHEPIMWGEWNLGRGYKVASTERGDLYPSGYMMARYLNQLPPHENEPDHPGNLVPVQARQDFQFHRVMLYASGWFLNPKFKFYVRLDRQRHDSSRSEWFAELRIQHSVRSWNGNQCAADLTLRAGQSSICNTGHARSPPIRTAPV